MNKGEFEGLISFDPKRKGDNTCGWLSFAGTDKNICMLARRLNERDGLAATKRSNVCLVAAGITGREECYYFRKLSEL